MRALWVDRQETIYTAILCIMSPDDIANFSDIEKKFDDQDQHECDVWGQGQSDAEGAASGKRCSKNPGHPGFIPAATFNMEHLPEQYRHPSMLEAIILHSDLSVRLRVKYTTKARPPGFPFSKFGGKNVTHTGSGMVGTMLENPEIGPCPCPECLESLSADCRKSQEVTTTDEGGTNLNYTNDSGNSPAGVETQDTGRASGCQTKSTRTSHSSKENLHNANMDSGSDQRMASNPNDGHLTISSNHDTAGAQSNVQTDEDKSTTANDEIDIVKAMTNWLTPKDADDIYSATRKRTSSQVTESDSETGNLKTNLAMSSPIKKNAPNTAPITPRNWWQVKVRTAMHVVYDHMEAASTLIDFYYEENESNREKWDEENHTATTTSLSAPSLSSSFAGSSQTALRNRVITMRGVCLTSFNSDTDECEILCITHDEELAKILRRDLLRFNNLLQNLTETVTGSLSNTSRTEPILSPLCVIASHPHGCAKTLTVGEWKERRVIRRVDSAMVLAGYDYTADTCPGSSGATIFLCGHGVGEGLLAFQSISTPCHSGSWKSGFNFSAPWVEWESLAVSDSDNDGESDQES